jgi:hypothetical protein
MRSQRGNDRAAAPVPEEQVSDEDDDEDAGYDAGTGTNAAPRELQTCNRLIQRLASPPIRKRRSRHRGTFCHNCRFRRWFIFSFFIFFNLWGRI